MESPKSALLQRYEQILCALEHWKRYSSYMDMRLSNLMLWEKIRVATEELEYNIKRGQTELLMDIGVDFSYQDIINDPRWNIQDKGQSLLVPNNERSSYHLLGDNIVTTEYIKSITDPYEGDGKDLQMNETMDCVGFGNMMKSIGADSVVSNEMLERMIVQSILDLRAKMEELCAILSNPNEAFYEELYDRTFDLTNIEGLNNTLNKQFDSWKALHLKDSSKEIRIYRLDDYLIKCMTDLFDTCVLDNVERLKSRAELKAFENDIDFTDMHTKGEECNRKYLILVELFDCPSKPRNCLPIYVPNKQHIGRLLYKNRHSWTSEVKEELIRFVLMVQLIQNEKMPKEESKELNYEAVIINMNEKYFKMCESALMEGYDLDWLNGYIRDLMSGKYRDEIAVGWAIDDRRMKVVCFILGALVDAKVLDGSYADIAKQIFNGKERGEVKEKKLRTLANYMGQGKKQTVGDWTKEYIEGNVPLVCDLNVCD